MFGTYVCCLHGNMIHQNLAQVHLRSWIFLSGRRSFSSRLAGVHTLMLSPWFSVVSSPCVTHDFEFIMQSKRYNFAQFDSHLLILNENRVDWDINTCTQKDEDKCILWFLWQIYAIFFNAQLKKVLFCSLMWKGTKILMKKRIYKYISDIHTHRTCLN